MLHQILRDSFWGTIIYRASSRKYFTYREENVAYELAEKYGKAKELSDYGREFESSTEISGRQLDSSNSSEDKTLASDTQILVDWDGDDDPDNPYNWPLYYKVIFVAEIVIFTSVMYMAAAIHTPGIEQIMDSMHVSRVLATFPLTFFVIGYGVGPMVLSPLSENARFGRTAIYIITLFLFFILQIPTSLVTDIISLTVLRFLAGFCASPCLATGGASVGDVISIPYLPMALAGWSAGAVAAPSIGPLIGSALIVAEDYHWPFWFMAMLSGVLFLVMSFFLPESYGKTILYKKAERLRALTGNMNITSEGHIENAQRTNKDLIVQTLWRPLEIFFFEPVIMLIDIYMAFLYSILYLWFESFPIVFMQIHKFTLVGLGASYLSLICGLFVGMSIHLPIIYNRITKRLVNGGDVPPEAYIPMSIFGACLLPMGLIIFAWTSTASVHWIAPMIGAGTFMCGMFIVYQTLFNYMGMSFTKYLASVYAGSDFVRSVMGGAFPLFGAPLFNNLSTQKYPIAWGTMILAFITMAMILVPVLFYLNGPKLRARSKYSNTE